MPSVISMALRALIAFTLALYMVYPRETGQRLRDLLQTSEDAFCPKGRALAQPSQVMLNRGQCAASGPKKPQPSFQSLLGTVATAFNAQR